MKRIFITGISKGIGKSIAILLKSKGYDVVGSCRNPESLTDKIEGVEYVSLDLNNKESIAKCSQQVGKIDVLINNAGHSQLGSLEDTPMEDFRRMYEVGLFGALDLTKRFLPHMREQRSGLIIFIGSMAGTFPLPYYTNYCSVKSAIKNISYSLRAEMKQFGVNVCLIEPSDLKTTIRPEFSCPQDSEYYENGVKILNQVERNMQNAISPNVVANKILKLIESDKVYAMYSVGGIGPLLTFLKRFSPDRLMEFTISKMYNLDCKIKSKNEK